MIVLSDCLTNTVDEGCLKVANNLAKRLKKVEPSTTIISYERKADYSDIHMQLNKLFLNKVLHRFLAKKKEPVLYIPFASNTIASCMRTVILSLFSKRKVTVLFVLRFHMNRLAKFLLKLSRANIIALSESSFRFFREIVGERVFYLKTGIDTEKFTPVDQRQKRILREKYHIPLEKKVILHVGHLKRGRNVDKLVEIDKQYHIVLVVSSVTEAEKDMSIRDMFEERGNVTIIDSYLQTVQEIYQLADVYLFPVQEVENCIDVPLSVLEAAACNIPIVTTEYGELNAFKGREGFLFVDDLSPKRLNEAVEETCKMTSLDTRSCVQDYDWNKSIVQLLDV